MNAIKSLYGKRIIWLIVGMVATMWIVYLFIVPVFVFSGFYKERANFEFHAKNDNSVAVSDSLRRIDYYRSWSRDVISVPPLSSAFRWFSDKYVFRDDTLYVARQRYVIGDYDRVLEELADREDSEAMTLMGVAKYRSIQLEYLEKLKETKGTQKSKALKAEYVDKMINEVSVYFEKALKADPDGRFIYKWNYDLVSDPESLSSAIGGEGPPIMFILDKGQYGDKENEELRLDEKSNPSKSDKERKS